MTHSVRIGFERVVKWLPPHFGVVPWGGLTWTEAQDIVQAGEQFKTALPVELKERWVCEVRQKNE